MKTLLHYADLSVSERVGARGEHVPRRVRTRKYQVAVHSKLSDNNLQCVRENEYLSTANMYHTSIYMHDEFMRK